MMFLTMKRDLPGDMGDEHAEKNTKGENNSNPNSESDMTIMSKKL